MAIVDWKGVVNLFVTTSLIVIAGFYAHAFEQWFVERLLNAFQIHSFSSYVTQELFNWLPTILVGFLLSTFIYFLTFEPGKIWWVLAAAGVLSALSYRDRISLWTEEAPFMLEFMVDARHLMYFLGALTAVLLIRLLRDKLTGANSKPG